MTPAQQRKLNRIDSRAARYSRDRSKLSARYNAFRDQLEKLQAKHLPKIKAALDKAASTQSELEQTIAAAPELFKEPRTLTLHGIRLGFMDGQPSVKLPRGKNDLESIVTAIRERFTAEEIAALELIERISFDVPSKDALVALFTGEKTNKRAGTLPGVEFIAAGDRVFIKPADHALDKVIGKLLQEGLKQGAADDGESTEAAA